MVQVNVQDAKAQLSKLLAAVERGDEVVIARNGRPIARLEPIASPAPRELGILSMSIPDSFFEELPEAELAAWER
ncbi:type II toxin-antitoxin system Phd/YefM family antitoxin [Agromyces sp. NPDC058484]|uniref:type II toxin-antitoxin system Phd/YefM family antitoxin n=1 Tax=Agromyces sp. NPDC058484 TaxID=3346524 RepID=UPI003647432F